MQINFTMIQSYAWMKVFKILIDGILMQKNKVININDREKTLLIDGNPSVDEKLSPMRMYNSMLFSIRKYLD